MVKTEKEASDKLEDIKAARGRREASDRDLNVCYICKGPSGNERGHPAHKLKCGHVVHAQCTNHILLKAFAEGSGSIPCGVCGQSIKGRHDDEGGRQELDVDVEGSREHMRGKPHTPIFEAGTHILCTAPGCGRAFSNK